jgi:hypothetical protein
MTEMPWILWKWFAVKIASTGNEFTNTFRTWSAKFSAVLMNMDILQMQTITAPTEKGNEMVVDIGEVKRNIKPKADSTLRNMRKDDLIEYIRCLENNYNVAVSFNENQARYIESLGIKKVIRCKDCKFCERDHTLDGGGDEYYYCWHVVMEHGQVRPNEFCCYGERKDND